MYLMKVFLCSSNDAHNVEAFDMFSVKHQSLIIVSLIRYFAFQV